jgi:ABC-type maltose transport system permease subunit
MARESNKLNLQASSLITRSFILLFIIFMAIFILGPLFWLAARAFVTSWTFPNLLPDGLTLEWWRVITGDESLKKAIRNSLIISPIVVLAASVICLPAAYAFARYKFFGRKTFLIGMFAANAFPKIGLFAAIATLYYTLNLMGTVLGVRRLLLRLFRRVWRMQLVMQAPLNFAFFATLRFDLLCQEFLLEWLCHSFMPLMKLKALIWWVCQPFILCQR